MSLCVLLFLSHHSLLRFLTCAVIITHCTLTSIHPFYISYLFIIKRKWIFLMVKWLDLVKAPFPILLPIANQERTRSDVLIFVNFIHSLVRFSLVCSYEVSNMKWVARRICLLTRGMHDERKKKWCEMEDWDSVSLDAQTQCVSLLLVFFQLYLLFLTFHSYDWYSFLILFSLGLIPPWPLYTGWW